MTILPYLSFIIVLFTLLASFTLYFQPTPEFYLKIFPLYMLITALFGGMLIYFSFHRINSVVLFNLFSTFEFCFYLFVLQQIIRDKRIKKSIFFILIAYPLLTLFNTFLLQKITAGVLTFSYALGCLLVVVFSIYYFFELFQIPNAVNLITQPSFWICSGLLFYCSCAFPVFSLLNLLKKPSLAIGHSLAIISYLLDACLYLSFTIAFLCRIKIRKSM